MKTSKTSKKLLKPVETWRAARVSWMFLPGLSTMSCKACEGLATWRMQRKRRRPRGLRAGAGVAGRRLGGWFRGAARAARARRLIGVIGVIRKFAIKISKNRGLYIYIYTYIYIYISLYIYIYIYFFFFYIVFFQKNKKTIRQNSTVVLIGLHTIL